LRFKADWWDAYGRRQRRGLIHAPGLAIGPSRQIASQSPAGQCKAFKLMMSAQTKWRKPDGANRMPEITRV